MLVSNMSENARKTQEKHVKNKKREHNVRKMFDITLYIGQKRELVALFLAF